MAEYFSNLGSFGPEISLGSLVFAFCNHMLQHDDEVPLQHASLSYNA